MLIAIGNWEASDAEIKLNIDWSKLKIKNKSAKLTAPAIEGFQSAGEYAINKPLKVPGGKGLLLVLD